MPAPVRDRGSFTPSLACRRRRCRRRRAARLQARDRAVAIRADRAAVPTGLHARSGDISYTCSAGGCPCGAACVAGLAGTDGQAAVHCAVECGAVLGDVNALREHRCAPPARAARPSGVDVACAQLTDSICAIAGARPHDNQRALTAAPPRHILNCHVRAYTRHPFASPDVKPLRVDAPEPRPASHPNHNTRWIACNAGALHAAMQHRSHAHCDCAAEHIVRSLMSAESLITRRDRLQRVA